MDFYRDILSSITPYFQLEEIASPMLIKSGLHAINWNSVVELHRLRAYVGKPFLINHKGFRRRGFRHALDQQVLVAELRPKGVEVATHSMHFFGAFDITCPGHSVEEFKSMVLAYNKTMGRTSRNPVWGGIGTYNTFTHIDLRIVPTEVFW